MGKRRASSLNTERIDDIARSHAKGNNFFYIMEI